MKNKSKAKVSLTKSQFDNLRNDDAFILIIRLTRYVNQILFCFDSYNSAQNLKTAIATRQQINSLLLLGGILFECLHNLYQALNREFKD
ncbi:MAG TPA: hypothetical protein PKY82_29155, partial [Pyrinomonadaceae bacterium]|nr:hypothetical protein [Pyrinomonadaceae bacterium]